MSFQIEPLCEDHFEQLYLLFDAVCRERRFLAFTTGGTQEQAFSYYRDVLASGHSHFVAVRAQRVLGWCDVLPLAGQMRAHVGVLGMAVAAGERGRGIGTALILAALDKAAERGISRVELTVHSENAAALALYRSVGFEQEGTHRRGWCLDGLCSDVHFMARLH